jgi:ABC-type multidrug transport system fused ATPase/permease subunit
MTSHPISALSGFYGTANSAAAAGRRVFELMDMTPEVAEPEGALELPRLQGAIDFESVHFHYDSEKPVLRGIDLSIRPGEVVAVVGANGAGKTTLVNMVPRFYDPVSGSIKVDGHDLKEVKLRSLRTQIGTVIQESVLFGGTIDDNIRCGNPTATDEEVLRASKLANAHEFIERMPDGYQTEVGERGLRLSGGQRQRIAIARALLRDPRILILDEYTSGIDAESENLIADAIARAMEGRTCLVIAHRLNTIRHADRLYEAQLREPLRTSTETEVPE